MNRGKLRDLTKVEWDLMNRIWRRRSVTVADVHNHFLKERGWSYNTVKTMMQRLVKKGYLLCDDSQRAHTYSPAVSRRRVVRRTLAEALDRILDDGFDPLVAYAAKRRNLSDEEIERLRELLEKEAADDG
jgi:BlaI family penicillinase repressor